MRKKKEKKILLLIIILVIIAIILIWCIKIISEKEIKNEVYEQLKGEQEIFMEIDNDPSIIINGSKPELVKTEGTYYTISDVIKKYNNYLEEDDAKAIYSVLYDEYTENYNITEDNVLEKIYKISNYKINEISGLATTVYGIYYVKIEIQSTTQYILVNWDITNNTFSICPLSEEEYNRIMELGVNVDKERIKAIEKNKYNKVIIRKVTSEGIAEDYFYDYIEKMLYNTQDAYNLLDNEYRKKNFPTYKDFENYVINNKVILESLDHNNLKSATEFKSYNDYENYYNEVMKYKMEEYAAISNNGIKTYIYKDSYKKYYIFKVSAAMKYTVMLDNYTIPTEDFIQTYNESSEVEKVVLNIKRFYMGIDDKNYGYSYSVLSESFKGNKYPTKDAFVQYAKQNFFEENEIEYISCEKQNGLYIYKIKIKDATGKNTETKTLNMIVKLNNGTDFEMSFGTD